jgi:Domain of unknown function (DUF4360)
MLTMDSGPARIVIAVLCHGRRLPWRAAMPNPGPTAVAALGAALALSPVPASAAADVPPPGSVSVSLTSLNGTGCRPGTVTIDSTVASFRARDCDYQAAVGADRPPTSFRKNCSMDVLVSHPPEFTYGIPEVEQKGFGELRSGVTGTIQSAVAFHGQNVLPGRENVVRGPYYDRWQVTERGDLPVTYFKPCDKPNTNSLITTLRVNAPDRTKVSFMALDSTDSDLGSTYRFSWKRC